MQARRALFTYLGILIFTVTFLTWTAHVQHIQAQALPPMPPGVEAAAIPVQTEPPPLRIAWDRNPAADYFSAVDTNGVPSPIVYRIRFSTNIVTPLADWVVIHSTTNTEALLSNLPNANLFFAVSSSNFFFGNGSSAIVALPYDPPTNLRLIAR